MKTRLPKLLSSTILLVLALLLVPVANAAIITVNSAADNLTGGALEINDSRITGNTARDALSQQT